MLCFFWGSSENGADREIAEILLIAYRYRFKGHLNWVLGFVYVSTLGACACVCVCRCV